MTLIELTLIFALPPLLIASALCSASETIIFSLRPSHRVRLAKVGPAAASAANTLLARPRQFLVGVLLLNTAVNTAYFVVASVLARSLVGPYWQPVFSIGAVVAIILAGEVIPKVIASQYQVPLARRLARTIAAVFFLIAPARVLLESAAITPLTRLLRPAGGDRAPPITADELSALLEHGAQRGAIDEDEQRLLAEVVELGSTRVRDIMIPRVDIRWIDRAAHAEALTTLIQQTGLTRFPVVDHSPDDGVLGWLNARRLLARGFPLKPSLPIADLLEPVHFVPDRARLDQLLDEFRRQRTHVALCVDELGAVTGMVHIRDVVGQLLKSAAEGAQSPDEQVRPLGDGRWLVPGRLGVRDWEVFLGPAAGPRDRRASTLAGLILQTLGRVPVAGDSVRLGNMRLEIDTMSGPVIQRVIVSAAPQEPAR